MEGHVWKSLPLRSYFYHIEDVIQRNHVKSTMTCLKKDMRMEEVIEICKTIRENVHIFYLAV